MKTIIFPTPKTFKYTHYWVNEVRTITLGQDGVSAVLLDEHDELIEWFTTETPNETAVNFATDAATLLVYAPNRDDNNIKAAIMERDLYADFAGYQHIVVEDELMITEDVK